MENKETLRKYGVKRIGLFGSHVRGTATAGSDIDFLVELERLTFRDYMGLALFLEDWYEKHFDIEWLRDLWRQYPVLDYGRGWD